MAAIRTALAHAHGDINIIQDADLAYAPADFPRLVDFYLRGVLPLDRMITRTYPLAEINAAFDALGRGDNARGLITPTS